jgi:hypothetical protein
MKTAIAALFLSVLGPTLATADALPKPVEAMQVMVGTWKGTGTMTIGKDKTKVDLTWTCKAVSGKSGISCTGVMKGIPGLATYDETDLFGYESNTDTYHWYAVTNGGETHDHVATKGGSFDKLQYVFTGTQEGKPFKEVVDVTASSKKITIRSESFVAGQSVALLDAAVIK